MIVFPNLHIGCLSIRNTKNTTARSWVGARDYYSVCRGDITQGIFYDDRCVHLILYIDNMNGQTQATAFNNIKPPRNLTLSRAISESRQSSLLLRRCFVCRRWWDVVLSVVDGETLVTHSEYSEILPFSDYTNVAVQMYHVPPHTLESIWSYRALSRKKDCKMRTATVSVSEQDEQ